MRRATSLLVGLSLLRFTALDVVLPCDGHVARSQPAQVSHAAHEQAPAMHHHDAGAPDMPTRAPDDAPAPKCCLAASACAIGAAEACTAAPHDPAPRGDAAIERAAAGPPAPARAPEPPPPRS